MGYSGRIRQRGTHSRRTIRVGGLWQTVRKRGMRDCRRREQQRAAKASSTGLGGDSPIIARTMRCSVEVAFMQAGWRGRCDRVLSAEEMGSLHQSAGSLQRGSSHGLRV
jgi:hypothetical protein